MEWISLVLLGCFSGAYGVIVGAGGGFILAPVLIVFYGLDPRIAVGTSLTLVMINSFSGTIAYWRKGLIDVRSGILFMLAAIPGSILGPFILNYVPGNIFKILFGILLLMLSLQIALKTIRNKELNKTINYILRNNEKLKFPITARNIISTSGDVYSYKYNLLHVYAINTIIGFLSSFFGTGGGFIRTPLLVYVFKIPIKIAVATSIFSLTITAFSGSVVHGIIGNVNWYPTLLYVGVGLLIGAQLGVSVSDKVSGKWVMIMLLLVVFGLGIQLILEAI